MSAEVDGGLEALLGFGEETPEDQAGERPRSRPWWIVRNVLLVTAATLITLGLLHTARVKVPVLLIVAAFVALRLLILAVAQVAPPPLPRPRGRGRSRADDARSAGADALRAAVRRWEQRLEWSQSDPGRFSRNVLPVLAELTDERLRRRHGITRSSDPRRARELLGEPLWSTLDEPGRRPPRARELAAYVDVLERL
jgi:hypothetical protein